MGPYIYRDRPGIGAAVVVMVALCLGWPVNDGLTQADGAATDTTLTVEACIGSNAASGPLQEALVREGIIEEGLLQTRVTRSMCKEMLAPIPGGTPAQRLVAARNYIQEIELIEGAMKEATVETATRGPDRGPSRDEPSNPFRAIAFTGEQVPALAQYDAPGDGVTGGKETVAYQAASAASAGEDPDASIPDRLEQKEAALREAGASAPEAAAGGRCSLQVDVTDEDLEKTKGLYEISPLMPEKMRHEEVKRAGLRVSPLTKERLQEIRRKQGVVAEASESDINCVRLTHRMKAQLLPYRLDDLVIDRHQADDVRELSSSRDTMWGWDITARRTGELGLEIELGYAISRDGQEYRQLPKSPIYDGTIKVTPSGSGSSQNGTERSWWRRILERISGLFGG